MTRNARNWNAVLVGTGQAAEGMLLGLREAGIAIKAVAGRSAQRARSLLDRHGVTDTAALDSFSEASGLGDFVIIAVPDKAIAEVAQEISENGGFRPDTLVVHLSGALPARILDSARARGARIGALHPLLSFAGRLSPEIFQGATFGVEGESSVLADLNDLVRRLGGQPITVPGESKALYHAAAAVVSNFTVTLFDLSQGLLESMGIPREAGAYGLASLLRSTLANIERVGLPQALTGPIARGDAPTIDEHLKALKDAAPHLLGLYAALGAATIDVALRKKTLGEKEAEILRTLFARHL